MVNDAFIKSIPQTFNHLLQCLSTVFLMFCCMLMDYVLKNDTLMLFILRLPPQRLEPSIL